MAAAGRKIKILIFNGALLNTTRLEHRLRNMGHSVCAVSTVLEESLAYCGTHSPQLILMPVPRSDDVIHWAETIRETSGIPVVFIADQDQRDQIARAAARFPYGHVLSPFQDADIQMAMDRALYISTLENRLEIDHTNRQKNEILHRALFENAGDAIFLENFEDEIIDVNKKACDLLGYAKEELLGLKLKNLIAPEELKNQENRVEQELKNYDNFVFESVNLHKSGKRIPVEVTTSCVFEEHNGLAICIVRDTSERKKAEREREQLIADLTQTKKLLEEKNDALRKLSTTDPLTSLYNRVKLDEVMQNEYERALRYGGEFGIILMDIDLFKKVNDTYGHQTGDQFLIEIADILRTSLRKIDTVGRWGGDEFVAICPQTDRKSLIGISEKLRSTIAAHEFTDVGPGTASFGLSLFNRADSMEAFIARADDALYQSKRAGRNKVSFKR